MNLNLLAHSTHTKINLTAKCKPTTIKFLYRTEEKIFCKLEVGKGCLDRILKSKNYGVGNDKLDSRKLTFSDTKRNYKKINR